MQSELSQIASLPELDSSVLHLVKKIHVSRNAYLQQSAKTEQIRWISLSKDVHRTKREFRDAFNKFMRDKKDDRGFIPFLRERDHLGRIIGVRGSRLLLPLPERDEIGALRKSISPTKMSEDPVLLSK